jgi:hypothetical protein
VSSHENTYLAAKTIQGWELQNLTLEDLQGQSVHQVAGLSPSGLFLAATSEAVHLLNAQNGTLLNSFVTEKMQPRSLQCAHSLHRTSQDGVVGLTSLTLCYTGRDTGDCIIENFLPSENADAILAEVPSGSLGDGWCDWKAAKKAKKRIGNPGSWATLFDGSVLGIRRQTCGRNPEYGAAVGSLRRRLPRETINNEAFTQWELWTVSPGGRMDADEHRPLFDETEQAGHLIISELGPKVKVGSSSVAFAFGNIIKIATRGGQERWETNAVENGQSSTVNLTGRRRKAGSGRRQRA